jgi:hypothetical protein
MHIRQRALITRLESKKSATEPNTERTPIKSTKCIKAAGASEPVRMTANATPIRSR